MNATSQTDAQSFIITASSKGFINPANKENQINMERILGHDSTRKTLIAGMIQIGKFDTEEFKKSETLLVGVAPNGALIATLIAHYAGKDCVIIDSKDQENQIWLKETFDGKNVIMINDCIITGQKSTHVAHAIQEAGGSVYKILTVYDAKLPLAEQRLAGKTSAKLCNHTVKLKEGCKVESFITPQMVIEYSITQTKA